MTIDEVLAPVIPVIVPIAYAIAVLAVLLLIRHLARRYPAVPARVPVRIRIDGRPSKRTAGKTILWLVPGLSAATIALCGIVLLRDPPKGDERVPFALTYLVFAEVVWFVAWMLDRQIELARKMTHRIAPARMLRVLLPIIASVVIVLVIAARG
jgi:hypothetical protein